VYLKHLQKDLILPINVNKTRIIAQTGRWGYDVIPWVLSAFLIEKSKLEGILVTFYPIWNTFLFSTCKKITFGKKVSVLSKQNQYTF
jgi:hypothetical protein